MLGWDDLICSWEWLAVDWCLSEGDSPFFSLDLNHTNCFNSILVIFKFCYEVSGNSSIIDGILVIFSYFCLQTVKDAPHICFLSGLTGEEIMMFVDAFPEAGKCLSYCFDCRYSECYYLSCWYIVQILEFIFYSFKSKSSTMISLLSLVVWAGDL